MSDLIQVLNLGAGVQSTAVLLMSLERELPPLDHVIFSDTGWEPQAVYDHLEWLKTLTTIHLVSSGNIKQDALTAQKAGASMDRDPAMKEAAKAKGAHVNSGRWASMPFFTLGPNGEKGMIRRQCTSEYKIKPIETFIRRKILGLKYRQRGPKEPTIRQWYGISLDEMRRMAKNPNKFTVNYYPLIEKRLTRQHCLEWLEHRGVKPPRSACIGCPFKHDREWRLLKNTSPEEFQDAVEFDKAVRKLGGMRGDVYLHSQRVPLDEVDFTTDVERGQLLLWDEECAGMCGV